MVAIVVAGGQLEMLNIFRWNMIWGWHGGPQQKLPTNMYSPNYYTLPLNMKDILDVKNKTYHDFASAHHAWCRHPQQDHRGKISDRKNPNKTHNTKYIGQVNIKTNNCSWIWKEK
jgi:hypothetical protein